LSSPTPTLVVLPIGATLVLQPVMRPSGPRPAPGTAVGTLSAAAGTRTVAWWTVQTAGPLDGPPWWWQLQNG
jgi:hypothetical protein